MYRFNIKEISKEVALEMIQKYHYSNTLPKLNKYFLGFFVYNIKAYLLAALFNAGATISNYYRAEVNHDMPQFAG